MSNARFSTVGREIFPGYELKISCSRNADCLDNTCLHERFRIVSITSGSAVFTNGNSSQIVTSPAVLFLNEQDDVALHDPTGFKMDVMYFEPTCFGPNITFDNLSTRREEFSTESWFFRPFFTRNGTYIGACPVNQYIGTRVSQLIELADAELKAQRDDSWPCRSRSYFIELLLLANSIYDEDAKREKIYLAKMDGEIRDVVEWLNIHYHDKITLETVTREFHTNKTTLNQKFKAVMSITVTEYLGNLRMQVACSLLRKTELPVKEITQRAGFRDDAHFLRSFKRYARCAPSEYRSQFAKLI